MMLPVVCAHAHGGGREGWLTVHTHRDTACVCRQTDSDVGMGKYGDAGTGGGRLKGSRSHEARARGSQCGRRFRSVPGASASHL